jgi:hypothetical protein
MSKRATSESQHLQLRITVIDPPAGVRFRMQRGRTTLEEPTLASEHVLSFDFEVRIGTTLASGRPNFVGEFTQGMADDRFVYVNSGTLAGDKNSPWERRAKVKLAGIDSELLQRALSRPDDVLEAQFSGTSKDGGPACATVPILSGWRLVPR